jgi:hypothetical protein
VEQAESPGDGKLDLTIDEAPDLLLWRGSGDHEEHQSAEESQEDEHWDQGRAATPAR